MSRRLELNTLHAPPPAPPAVVKCRVVGPDQAHKGLKLALLSRKRAQEAAGAEAAAEPEPEALGGLQPGDEVTGVIKAVHMREVRCR